MARLTKDEWAELRAEWEASPRQGLTWLIASAGGRWEITEEAIRRRRLVEGWTKRGNLADVARKARNAADKVSVARMEEEAKAPPVNDPEAVPPLLQPRPEGVQPDAEQASVDLRTALLDRHRKEWEAIRAGLYRAMAAAKDAKGFDVAKFAKINSETLKNIQDAERRAYSLDADLMDYESMTDEQLARVAAGKLPG